MTEQPRPRATRSRRALLAIGGGAVLAAAGASLGAGALLRPGGREGAVPPAVPSPSPGTDVDEPWPPPRIALSTTVPTEFRFSADPGVAPGEEALLREGADLARDFYFRTFGVYLANTPRIHLNNSPSRSGVLGDADGQSIRIYVGSAVWPRLTRVDKLQVMCHEVFHLLQSAMSNSAFPAIFFLVEGTAEFSGQQAVIRAGMRTREEFLGTALRAVRAQPQPPLLRVSTSTGGGNYPVSALAIDRLVGEGAMKTLGEYFGWLREPIPPSVAFERAFGISVEAFEARFEAWRSENGIPAQA